jgi:hypothetical protein
VLGEVMAKDLWNKLGTLYQSKSLVKKLFLWKKLYNLRMKDGDPVKEHLNCFNIVVSQLLYVDIKIFDEDKCISLLLPLPDSWDILVVAIGSNSTTLNFNDVVSSLLSKEMKWKNMESLCWRCGKEGHYKKQCRSKSVERGKGSDDAPSTRRKTSGLKEGMCTWLLQAHMQIMRHGWLTQVHPFI